MFYARRFVTLGALLYGLPVTVVRFSFGCTRRSISPAFLALFATLYSHSAVMPWHHRDHPL